MPKLSKISKPNSSTKKLREGSRDIILSPSAAKKHPRKTKKSIHKSHTAEDQRKKNRFILAGVILLIAFIIIPIVFFLLELRKTVSVEIILAPSFAKVEIDGKKYTSGTKHLAPYTGKATVSAKGFTSKEVEVNFVEGEASGLYVYLVPEDGDMDWYEEHPSEREILSAIGDSYAIIASEKYHHAHPIISVLPAIVSEIDPTTQEILHDYRIDYGEFTDCKTDFCLKITDHTGKDHQHALQYIKDKGFDPEDYQIIYEDDSLDHFTSPRANNDPLPPVN